MFKPKPRFKDILGRPFGFINIQELECKNSKKKSQQFSKRVDCRIYQIMKK